MGAAVLAIAVAGGFGAWWWTHPTAFRDLGDSFALQPRPVDEAVLSTTVIFPKVDGEPETVTIDSLGPVFSKNTARATAAFSICHLSPGEDPIGAAHDPAEFCQDLEPFEAGASFRHGVEPDSDYLLVTLVPATAGVARLARVEIGYRLGADHLYQRGTQSIRVDRKVTAR